MGFGPLVPEFMEKDNEFNRQMRMGLDDILSEETYRTSKEEIPTDEEGRTMLGCMALTDYEIIEDGKVVGRIEYDSNFNMVISVAQGQRENAEAIKERLDELVGQYGGSITIQDLDVIGDPEEITLPVMPELPVPDIGPMPGKISVEAGEGVTYEQMQEYCDRFGYKVVEKDLEMQKFLERLGVNFYEVEVAEGSEEQAIENMKKGDIVENALPVYPIQLYDSKAPEFGYKGKRVVFEGDVGEVESIELKDGVVDVYAATGGYIVSGRVNENGDYVVNIQAPGPDDIVTTGFDHKYVSLDDLFVVDANPKPGDPTPLRDAA